MSCRRREEVDALVAGEVAGAKADAIREHLASCLACARRHAEGEAARSLLERLAREPLPPGFERSLARRLAYEPPPARPGRLARAGAWLRETRPRRAVAAVALSGLTLGAGNVALQHGRSAGSIVDAGRVLGEVAPVFFVPRAKVAVVRIDFQAEQAVEDVEFAIQLPEGLRFVSEGRELDEREFRWHGRLDRGSNPIPVAVRGLRPGRYKLFARAAASDVTAQHEVVLEVTSS